jgi:HlyD family secretion protein
MTAVSRIGLVVLTLLLAACDRRVGPTYQGWVEADMIFSGAEDQGRLVELMVDEGQTVKIGDPLFAIDSATQRADQEAANAALQEAASKLARLEAAQQRPEEIAVLEASQRQAAAALEFSTTDLERARTLVEKGFAAKSRLDQAQSAFDRDRAALDSVRRQIDVARLAGRQEDLDGARFAVAQAKALGAAAAARLTRLQIRATVAGKIQEVYFRPGEVVPMGRPVVAILPPENVKIRFFVPEANLPLLPVGSRISVTCDGCSRDLEAKVTFVSQQAEYTPPVIFSRDERTKLVFRAEARPSRNPELFRIGQPVTITPLSVPGSASNGDNH